LDKNRHCCFLIIPNHSLHNGGVVEFSLLPLAVASERDCNKIRVIQPNSFFFFFFFFLIRLVEYLQGQPLTHPLEIHNDDGLNYPFNALSVFLDSSCQDQDYIQPDSDSVSTSLAKQFRTIISNQLDLEQICFNNSNCYY
jgi:hypothetical protein